MLGHNDALFRRAQLKALVSIHSQEVSLVLTTFELMFYFDLAQRFRRGCERIPLLIKEVSGGTV